MKQTLALIATPFLGLFLTLVAPSFALAQNASSSDAKTIAEATKGTLKSTRGQYFDKSFNANVEYEAQVIDLNGDGQPEVFTRHHGAMFGGAGMSVNLLIKGKNGQWTPQFGFPGDYKILKTKNKGYPDIEIQGPGTCFPIWRWNGVAYELHKKCVVR